MRACDEGMCVGIVEMYTILTYNPFHVYRSFMAEKSSGGLTAAELIDCSSTSYTLRKLR
jgi:hypothetical protein